MYDSTIALIDFNSGLHHRCKQIRIMNNVLTTFRESQKMVEPMEATALENYFSQFRQNIIGQNHTISSPLKNDLPLVYCDWTASGRAYQTIEQKLLADVLPWVANTHTETNHTGQTMTLAYHEARQVIKQHVNAQENDVLIMTGSGMTGAVNKLQRLMGLKSKATKTKVLISHMEHHSNQLSWMACHTDVEIVAPCADGLVSLTNFEQALIKAKSFDQVIVSITACSNVTGIKNPVHDLALLAHKHNALVMIDYACSAPYDTINMNQQYATGDYFDAIFFSPHKFLGGVGTSGVLIMKDHLFANTIPDHPGGGTVKWTNPWGEYALVNDREAQEDGGTPPFIQTIKTAMAISLKEKMGVANIRQREKEQLGFLFQHLKEISNLHILASSQTNRLAVISFYIDGLHHNMAVKLLNDVFGIQVRGGCSCAGTYGHFLLNVSKAHSKSITNRIDQGDESTKPGWVRLSVHPTQSNSELAYIVNAIQHIAQNHKELASSYSVDSTSMRITAFNNTTEASVNLHIKNLFSF